MWDVSQMGLSHTVARLVDLNKHTLLLPVTGTMQSLMALITLLPAVASGLDLLCNIESLEK